MSESTKMRKVAEQILDDNLHKYPWQYWSKTNALNAMEKFANVFHHKMIGNLVFEDELPEMNDKEYSEWFSKSEVVDGVRMGKRPELHIGFPSQEEIDAENNNDNLSV